MHIEKLYHVTKKGIIAYPVNTVILDSLNFDALMGPYPHARQVKAAVSLHAWPWN